LRTGLTEVSHAKKIVLCCPHGYRPRLDGLVEDFIRDGVVVVAVVGEDCSRVEDIIDELVVGDGSRDCGLLTSSHPGESVAEAIEFVRGLTLELEGEEIEVVDL
jgi:hypothetical protein